jgi:hypothetical protein
MNIFSKIRNRIESIFSKIIGERKENPITYLDIQNDLTEISKQQESERENVIEKNKNVTLSELSMIQINLIEKKSETLNIRKSHNDFEKFKEINFEIERLETNLLLQSKIIFSPIIIDNQLISQLSVELKEESFENNLLPYISDKRLQVEQDRTNDLKSINQLKDSVLNFSLTQLHLKREEERKEIERIERERKINEQFETHLENSQEYLSQNNFNQAANELLQAIEIKPEKENEVNKFLSELEIQKYNYEKRFQVFKEVFEKAENNFHSGNLELAISLYKEGIKTNIDNLKCEKRISDVNHKIQRKKELEYERLKNKKEEKRKTRKIQR